MATRRSARGTVAGILAGPPFCGVPWLRRQLRRHPSLRVPPEGSEFWSGAYGEVPDLRAAHWRQAFRGLRGRVRVECDETLASLPSWKVGAMAAWNPNLVAVLVLRDPADRSWDALRDFHARLGATLRLGDDLSWVEDALRGGPDSYRGHSLGLGRDGDYAAIVRRWRQRLPEGRLVVAFHDDLLSRPDAVLAEVASRLGVDPDLVDADPEGLGVEVEPDVTLPDDPPPALAERLRALHRRQVRDLADLLELPLLARWG